MTYEKLARPRKRGQGSIQTYRHGIYIANAPGPKGDRNRLGVYGSEEEAHAACDAYLAGEPIPESTAELKRPGRESGSGRKPRDSETISRARRMGNFLAACREQQLQSEYVNLGRLPDFPNATNDPVVVEKAIGVIESQARVTNAPVAELRLRQRMIELKAALARMQDRDKFDEHRDYFIEHGAAWARDEGISWGAFRDFGVPAELLKAAGIPKA